MLQETGKSGGWQIKINSKKISDQIILASASQRRYQLLKKIVPHFKVVIPKIKEVLPNTTKVSPYIYVQNLARAKVENVASKIKIKRGIIIGADTAVWAKGKIIGKPRTKREARKILASLSGTTHTVITGVCVFNIANGRMLSGYEKTIVRMKKLSLQEITYLSSQPKHLNIAGAYSIQESKDPYVKIIKGRLDNAVGLPVNLVRHLIYAVKQ